MGQKLTNKTAIITGARDGIGYETAKALAAEGVNLGLIDRTEEKLQTVQQELLQHDVDVFYAGADVGVNEQVIQAVQQLTEQLGTIDILINNAGIAKFGGFLDLDVEEWEKIIQVNLLGMYYVTRAVLPKMIEQEAGDIINISSTAGQKGGPVTSAYSASKAGVLGLTESLAMEARSSIVRVSDLAPSIVVSDVPIIRGLVKGDAGGVRPEDMAVLMLALLKLIKRVFLNAVGLLTTNP